MTDPHECIDDRFRLAAEIFGAAVELLAAEIGEAQALWRAAREDLENDTEVGECLGKAEW